MKFSIQSVYEWYRGLIRNPKYRWWVLIGTLVYFVSPIDVIPDIFPIVGELDDVFLLTLLVSEFSQMLIEGFKTRKGDTETPTAANTSEEATEDKGTIDVPASTVEQ
ncbi:MAG: YkvA family protein [Cyanobacteria bacterium P01_D01_bin.50]